MKNPRDQVMNKDANLPPTVSVLLSTFNGEQYLQEAIDSILDQTFSDFEFIIVNDGSTDKTKVILENYRDARIVRLCHTTNQGLIASLNEGVSLASGQFIARIDHDDIAMANRLEEQVKIFKENPQLVIVGSYYHRIDGKGQHLKLMRKPTSDTEIRWTLLFENPFGQSSVMIRADILSRHSLRYDKEMFRAEDFDLWSRLLLHGKGINIDRPLAKIRHHSGRIGVMFVAEQAATADRIAWSNLQQLGISMSTYEVSLLRTCFREPPVVTDNDVKICRQLLEILAKFGKQEVVDPQQFAAIRYRLVNRILGAMSLSDLFIFNKMRLLRVLIREYRALIMRHLIKRVLWNIKKCLP